MGILNERDGDWFVNLFFWWVGNFVFGIINWIGQIAAIFTEWQFGYTTINGLVPTFAPPLLDKTYDSPLTVVSM